MVADNIVADAYWLRVIFADDIADDITFGYLTFRSLFYSFWCRFRTWWSFRRTSIIRRIRRGLVCFSFNLHVTGFSSCRITTMIHSYLVWFLWWVRHGAIGPSEATLFGVNVDWIDFRIYTFELVIRLSKEQQWALLLSTVFGDSRCSG